MKMTENKILDVLKRVIQTDLDEIGKNRTEIWADPIVERALNLAVKNIRARDPLSTDVLEYKLWTEWKEDFTEPVRSAVSHAMERSSIDRTTTHDDSEGESRTPFRFKGVETEKERLYRELVNSHIDKELSSRRGVQPFREELSGGRTLTEEEAWNLITHELAGVLTFECCKEYGLSPMHLDGKIVEHLSVTHEGVTPAHNFGQFGGWSNEEFRFTVAARRPDSEELNFAITHRSDTYKCLAFRHHAGLTYVHSEQNRYLAPVYPPRTSIKVTPAAGQQKCPACNYHDFVGICARCGEKMIPVPSEEAYENALAGEMIRRRRFVSGFHGSIAGIALDISVGISAAVQWEAKDALMWLLTGKVPEAASLNGILWRLSPSDEWGSHSSHGAMEIIAQPWVNPKNLKAFYESYTPPKVSKIPSVHSLELFRLVNQMTPDGQTPEWQKIINSEEIQDWKNSHNSEMANRASLCETYNRVKRHLRMWLDWGGSENLNEDMT